MQSFPYPKLNLNDNESLSESLKKYDPSLSFSKLQCLNLHGTPRDTSKFYKDSQKNLYLRSRFVQGKIEWTNVTSNYYWDKIEANPELPMFKFRKEGILNRFLCHIK